MHKIRVYVDTSVFGGTSDDEFAEPSKLFFERVRRGEYTVLVSEPTFTELAGAPKAVKAFWNSLPAECIEEIHTDDEVRALAEAYIDAGVLGRSSAADALHVASASVAGADLILSWNFKHIVNFNRIRGFNGVNVTNGYRSMTILSPLEIGDEDKS